MLEYLYNKAYGQASQQMNNATPLPPQSEQVTPPQSRDSGTLNALSTVMGLWGFGAAAQGYGTAGALLDIGAAGVRQQSTLEGQREAAGIIRQGLEGQGRGQDVRQSPSHFPGSVRWQSPRFGIIELITYTHAIDFNANGTISRNEMQNVKGTFYRTDPGGAVAFLAPCIVCNKQVKFYDERGVLVDEKGDPTTSIGMIQLLNIVGAPAGKYIAAFSAQVAKQEVPLFQRTPTDYGVDYFVGAIPFEIVGESPLRRAPERQPTTEQPSENDVRGYDSLLNKK